MHIAPTRGLAAESLRQSNPTAGCIMYFGKLGTMRPLAKRIDAARTACNCDEICVCIDMCIQYNTLYIFVNIGKFC